MITRVVIQGYRCFIGLDIQPNSGMNLIVGDNEAGKSTLLEAISLALTNKVNGRWASEELNPFWFNRQEVAAYFKAFGSSSPLAAPEIVIEVYLSNDNDLQQLRGMHNHHRVDCPGVRLHIFPSPDYETEFADYMERSPAEILPVEYYEIDWRDFSDRRLLNRPKALAVSFIDSRTIRSTSGVDYHTREMLSAHLEPRERAMLSVASRTSRQEIDKTLQGINDRIAKSNEHLHDRPVGLQMDQSSRSSWESGVVPQVDDIPFAMAGQGQQAAVKVALALSRTAGTYTFVLIEEPENHLSHTSLNRLVARIERLADDEQQLFVATHSSFVLNRLGLDKLLLLFEGQAAKLTSLESETVSYFRKLAGYDTLRLVLARKVLLVEGPSDAIVFERAFRDVTTTSPADVGIDIISMGGLTFKRALEVCACLDRQAIALQDNDGRTVQEITDDVAHLLKSGTRELLVSDPAHGATLEPQIVDVNDDATLRSVLGRTNKANLTTWMTNNKTEAALAILDAAQSITYPSYIRQAVELLK